MSEQFVRIEVDGIPVYIDRREAERVKAVDDAVSALPIDFTSEAVNEWIGHADFRHTRPRIFVQVVQDACVRFVSERRIDFSDFMHKLFKARFGEYRGDKFACAFDYLIKTFESY